MKLAVDIDDREVRDMLKRLSASQRAVAMQAAVSDTITTGVARVAREIRKEINLPIKKIKQSIDSKAGNFVNPTGSIVITQGKGLTLAEYARTIPKRMGGRSGRKGGLTMKIRERSRPGYPTPENFPRAFWAKMPGGHKGIYIRTGKFRRATVGKHAGKTREIIREKRGPSPLRVFLNARGDGGKKIVAAVVAGLADVLRRNMLSQIDRAINGKISAATLKKASIALAE